MKVYNDRKFSAGSIQNIAFERQHGILRHHGEASLLESRLGKIQQRFEFHSPVPSFCKTILTDDDSDHIATFWNESLTGTVYHCVKFMRGDLIEDHDHISNEENRGKPPTIFSLNTVTESTLARSFGLQDATIFKDPSGRTSMLMCYNQSHTCVHVYAENDVGILTKLADEIRLRDVHVYSCAYSSTARRAVFGMQSCGAVCDWDGLGRQTLTRIHNYGQPLTCAVFDSSGQVVYGGSRKTLVRCDLRDPETTFGSKAIRTKTNVFTIGVLKNGAQLLASCDDDVLLMYDLRTMRPLISYEEHRNTFFKIPFTVDEQLRVLCSVGYDDKTRVWNLDTAKLLKTIECPMEISYTQVPCAIFKSSWGKSFAMPSVIVGGACSVHVYHM